MKLYFLRHGHAEAGSGMDDHQRRLTSKGIGRISTAARVLAALEIRPAHIYSSPRVRAQQTAELVAGALNVRVEVRDEVNFGFSAAAARKLVAGLSPGAEVMFVGHEPSMSGVVEDLSGASVAMKKGGLARVDIADVELFRGRLVWLIAPRVFDLLADSRL